MPKTNANKPPDPPPGDAAKELDALRRHVGQMSEDLVHARQTISSLEKRLRSEAERPGAAPSTEQDGRRMARQLERQAMILSRDTAVARRFQESIRPLWLGDFEGIEFAMRTVPGARVSGDFYDVIKVSESTLALLIADVSGCGLPAAVMMVGARMAFRTFSTLESSPQAIMSRVNAAMLDATPAGYHLTAFLGLLDMDMLTLQYVNASHPAPFLIRGDELTVLDTNGFFVGMFDDPQYEQKSIQLDGGDKLFMFTDGLLQVLSDGSGQKPIDMLGEFLRDNSKAGVSEIVRYLNKLFMRSHEDDVAVLAVQLTRERKRTKCMTIASLPSEIKRVEDVLLPTLRAKGYGERVLFSIRLALEEAIINAIKHGNKLDSTKKVKVQFDIDEEKTVLRVEDEGEGFSPADVPDPTLEENLEAVAGRGLALMRASMDSVEYSEKGNVVTMVKASPW